MKWIALNNRLKLKFIIGTCLIAIVPILIFSVVSYQAASSSLQQEVGKAKIETLKQVQQRIDDKLITLNKNVIQHLYISSFDDFLKNRNYAVDLGAYRDLKSMLSSIEVLVDNVESASLYISKTDEVIHNETGIRPADELLEPVLHERIKQNQELFFWADDLNEHSSHRRSSKNITYVRAVPLKGEGPLGYLIIRLKDRTFFEVYDSLDNTSNSEMMIITPNGTVFSDWNRSLLNDELADYQIVDQILKGEQLDSSFYTKMDKHNMLVSYWQSPFNQWSYLSITPTKELMPRFNQIKVVTFAVCIGLIIACMIAALFISRSFYNGIRSIVERIRGKALTDGAERKDEISLINSYMDTLQELNDSLSNQVERSKPELASGFIQTLLLEPVRKKDLEQQFDYFNLPRVSDYYTSFCAELHVAEHLDEKDLQLFVYAVMNISGELFTEQSPGMITKLGPAQIAIVINHSVEQNSLQTRLHESFRFSESLTEATKKLLNIDLTIGMGRCYERGDIRKSFLEARSALQYRLVIGTGHVIYVEQVEPLQREASFEYPNEIEQQLIMQVKIGNMEQVRILLDQFSNKLREAPNMQASQVLMSYGQLVSHAIREFYQVSPEAAAELFSTNMFDKLAEMHTMAHMQQWVYHHIFLHMAQHFESLRNEKSYRSMEQVLTYIAEHYNEDISQPQLAEMVGAPPSHFSQMFKEELGMTFSDYLIMFRMEKAKELLIETDKKVFEIAECLRYQNSQNFIRTFKKVHGMTPGEFRAKGKEGG